MSELEQRQTEFAQAYNLTLPEYLKLVKALSYTELITCLDLLRAKSHRSGLRAFYAKEIRRWLDGRHLGTKPLCPADFKKAAPQHPLNIVLPTGGPSDV